MQPELLPGDGIGVSPPLPPGANGAGHCRRSAEAFFSDEDIKEALSGRHLNLRFTWARIARPTRPQQCPRHELILHSGRRCRFGHTSPVGIRWALLDNRSCS